MCLVGSDKGPFIFVWDGVVVGWTGGTGGGGGGRAKFYVGAFCD